MTSSHKRSHHSSRKPVDESALLKVICWCAAFVSIGGGLIYYGVKQVGEVETEARAKAQHIIDEEERAFKEKALASFTSLHTIRYTKHVNALAFSDCGKYLALATGEEARLLQLDTGEELRVIRGGANLNSLKLSPCGMYIAMGGSSAYLEVYLLASGQPIFTVKDENIVKSLDISRDSSLLAVGGVERTRVFHLEAGEVRFSVPHDDAQMSGVFSPCGQYLATAVKGHKLEVLRVSTQELVCVVKELQELASLAFSPCGRYLAVGDMNGLVKLVEIASGKMLSVRQLAGGIRSLDFSPCGKVLALASDANRVELLAFPSMKLLSPLELDKPRKSLAFSPCGKYLALCGEYTLDIKDISILKSLNLGKEKE